MLDGAGGAGMSAAGAGTMSGAAGISATAVGAIVGGTWIVVAEAGTTSEGVGAELGLGTANGGNVELLAN